MIKKALTEGVALDLWVFLLIILLAFLAGILFSYFRTKRRGLATKQQTKELEPLAQENHLTVKQEESVRAPSLADLDKRLAAHQEAHTLWTELMEGAELKEKADQVVMKCETWWRNNSQYLSPEVREVFRSAYRATRRHPDLLVQENKNWEEIKANFETIRKAGDVIFKAVFHPRLSQEPHGQS